MASRQAGRQAGRQRSEGKHIMSHKGRKNLIPKMMLWSELSLSSLTDISIM